MKGSTILSPCSWNRLHLVGVSVVLSTVSFGCTEDRCIDGDGTPRGVLEDTAPFTLCKQDRVNFSPSTLVVVNAASTSPSDAGLGDLDGAASEAGTAGNVAAVNDAGSGSTTLSREGIARVAVIARSPGGVPRSRAVIHVHECDAGASLALAPADNGECEVSGSRLRCLTNQFGTADFTVRLQPLGSKTGTSGVCADALAEHREPLIVTFQNDVPEGLHVEFAQRSLTMPPRAFALSCAVGDFCERVVRSERLRLRLRGTDCEAGGDCPALVNREVRAAVSVELAAEDGGTKAEAWLSSTEDCAGRRALALEAIFPARQSEAEPLFLCANSRPAVYDVFAQLVTGPSSAADRSTVTVEAHPVIVDLAKITLRSSPAADGGSATTPAELDFRYRTCAGAEIVPPPSLAGTLAVSADGFFRSARVSLDVAPPKLRVELESTSPLISVTGNLSGNVLDGTASCAWQPPLVTADGGTP